MAAHRYVLRIAWTLLSLTDTCTTQSDLTSALPGQTIVGVYHWSGQAARSISQGVNVIAGLGSSAARIALSARSHRDYNVRGECIEGFDLASFLRDGDVQQALSHPAIRTFMITAYDGVSFSDCKTQQFLELSFYTPENRARMVQEYAAFTLGLYRISAGTGKTFMITNWESDNTIYCGSSHQYSRDAEFRRACLNAYPMLYSGNRSPDDSMEALRLWFAVRWEGIKAGRGRAAALGIGGVEVYMGPEINSVRDLPEAGYRNVLTDVVPTISWDFVSYSSWEALNHSDPIGRLQGDIERIRTVADTPNLIIGELGYASAHWGSDTAGKTNEAIAAAAEMRIPYVFQWLLYEDATKAGFGLFDEAGRPTALALNFRARYPQPRRLN